jgi:SAM-dependent methyltransferase
MATSVVELIRHQDMRAATVATYTKEQSTIGELSTNFPLVEGKTFLQWLDVATKGKDANILEFGGGRNQVAASEILHIYDGVASYVGYDIRLPSEEGKALEREFPQYKFIQKGLADFHSEERTGVDVAFAHNVADHVPHPFQLVEGLYDVLQPGGLLYMNNILLYQEVARELVGQWRNEGYAVHANVRSPQRDLLRSGVVALDVGVRKTKDTIFVPPVTDTPLQDFTGRSLPTLAYRIPGR